MRKKLLSFSPIILLALTLGLGLYNLLSPQTGGFWSASAVQLLTPLVAVCLTFFATQMKNDQREAKKHAEMIIDKIQALVLDELFYKIPNTDDPEMQKEIRNQIQIINKKMNNCIDSLMAYGNCLNFETEANYIREEFRSYRALIDSASADLKELSVLSIALKNHAENISSKCDQISVKLYCPIKTSSKNARSS